ncbi:MAG: hypothetical protein ACE5R4_18685, partial [Armatimonadota bacterium]
MCIRGVLLLLSAGLATVLTVSTTAQPPTAGKTILVVTQGRSEAIDFAARDVAKAILARGGGAMLVFTERKQVRPLAVPPLGARPDGGMIVIGIPATEPVAKQALAAGKLPPPPEGPESFAIRTVDRGRGLRQLCAFGSDERGAMYAGLEVAERIRLDGLAADGGVPRMEKTGRPFLGFRCYKFNLPLEGTGYLIEEYIRHNDWFWDLDYWDKLTAQLARHRYNVLSFWSAHPYEHLVTLEKYPEATPLSHRELTERQQFFHKLFQLASDRGLDTYLVTWNIHVSEAFAKAHKVRSRGQDSPLIRDYQKECVRELLVEYPELTGVGTCPGEAMPGDARAKQEWIWDTYIKGIQESGRTVPFLLRYWGGAPKETEEVIAARYQGPVYVTLKYNGEHMYSSPRPHFVDQTWLNQEPRHYKIVWHLRNDDLYTLRWCGPQFARETLRNCRGDYSAGFLTGSEIRIPGADYIHTEEAAAHRDYTYEFEKFWARFMAWGRLAYDPDEPDDLFLKCHQERYGRQAGAHAFRALATASRIAPLVTSFHWNYMNGDWWPEANLGSWNTGAGRGKNYRDGDLWHSVVEWMFNHTMEDELSDIPQAVAGAPDTPTQVADELDEAATTCLAEAARAAGSLEGERPGFECFLWDMQAWGALGHYYADKIRGARALMELLATGNEGKRREAIEHLESAAEWWRKLSEVTGKHYAPHEVYLFKRFTWAQYQPDVDKDVEIARTIRADPDALKASGFLALAGEKRPSFDQVPKLLELGLGE